MTLDTITTPSERHVAAPAPAAPAARRRSGAAKKAQRKVSPAHGGDRHVAAASTSKVSPGLRRLVDLMDTRYHLPGTNIRFGMDAIIGLIPGIGDFFGMLVGAAVLLEGLRHRVPKRVLGAMVANLVIDAAIGALPIVGDTFDLFFKAHRRNLTLLEKHV